MLEVYKRLFVSDIQDCSLRHHYDDDWAVVHACKSPCHQTAVGYRGSLSNTHPNYLILEKENNLFMNLIDPPRPLFMNESFQAFFDFMRRKWTEERSILIHCNQGESRAPSLALLFMAKELATISNASYEDAAKEFLAIFPAYLPGLGIQKFLAQNWNDPQLLGA